MLSAICEAAAVSYEVHVCCLRDNSAQEVDEKHIDLKKLIASLNYALSYNCCFIMHPC